MPFRYGWRKEANVKKATKWLIFIAMMALAGVAVAGYQQGSESAVPAVGGQPMSPEDTAKLRDQLRQLGVVFGVDQGASQAKPANGQAAPASSATAAPADKKSMADVADRALTLVSGLVSSVSLSVQKVAPEVWRIMIRQQYAKAASGLITPWSLIVLTIVYWKIIEKKWVPQGKGEDDEKFFVGGVIPVIAGVAFGIWGIVAISDSIQYLINPEYYAVRDILIMVMNPSQIQ